ncbi:MAG: UbiA-like protein EboC [Ferruginibacter sp.]|nr:UbiA-like protein EboC [Cytophagales bacterium]
MPYLRLMRPANLVTAVADILAGFAASSGALFIIPLVVEETGLLDAGTLAKNLLLLSLSTIGLYGGGVVFNDVFDAELDAVERPERSIPSGKVSKESAAILGIYLTVAGIILAFLVSATSGLIALLVAILAIGYDKWGKHTPLGPINMGLCRGGNLLLGVSGSVAVQGWTAPTTVPPYLVIPIQAFWPLALIPVAYIAAITTISRGEVHGGSKNALYLAFGLYGLVILAIAGLSKESPFPIWQSLPFLALFALLIFPPLIRASRDRQPRHIGLAVKAGVIALIAMDAAMAATFAGWVYGLAVLALLPLSRLLARAFAVT